MLKTPTMGKVPPQCVAEYRAMLEEHRCGDVAFLVREAYLLVFTGYMPVRKAALGVAGVLARMVKGLNPNASRLGAAFFAGIAQFTEPQARDIYDQVMDWAAVK